MIFNLGVRILGLWGFRRILNPYVLPESEPDVPGASRQFGRLPKPLGFSERKPPTAFASLRLFKWLCRSQGKITTVIYGIIYVLTGYNWSCKSQYSFCAYINVPRMTKEVKTNVRFQVKEVCAGRFGRASWPLDFSV